MKTKIILSIFCFITLFTSCDDNTPGYLFTDEAGYNPDSLVIKSKLDIHDPTDSMRLANNIPWQSVRIEGVEGTSLINYQIHSISSDNPTDITISQLYIKNDGHIEIFPGHTLTPGRYILSILISNEGYTAVKDSIFTIIVK